MSHSQHTHQFEYQLTNRDRHSVSHSQHTHQFEFLKRIRSKLKKGGVLTYCNLTSLGVLKGQYANWADLFRETQLPHLLAAGWKEEEIAFETAPTNPTDDCEYYSHPTGLVPILTKSE